MLNLNVSFQHSLRQDSVCCDNMLLGDCIYYVGLHLIFYSILSFLFFTMLNFHSCYISFFNSIKIALSQSYHITSKIFGLYHAVLLQRHGERPLVWEQHNCRKQEQLKEKSLLTRWRNVRILVQEEAQALSVKCRHILQSMT